MKTQIEFFEANQVDGKLTDVQMSQMLHLPEGDSTAVQSDVPAVAATVPTPTAAVVVDPVVPAATTEQPVILAKDGVHTIPYEKLTEARAGEQAAKALADAAQAQTAELQKMLEDALKKAPTAQPAAPATPAPAQFDPSVFGDYSEEAIAKGIAKMQATQTAAIRAELQAEMDSKLAAALEPLQARHVETELDSHYKTINAKHPDVESVVPSAEFANWVNTQPSVVRDAIQATIDGGTAAQVIEVLDAYKATTSKPAAATGQPSAAAAAQAAIDKAKTAPPSSLSEIPAGSHAVTDTAEALEQMSSAGIMKMFEGKTSEQINSMLSKLI